MCTVCGYVCVHTGGTATCTAKAICTYCGEAYGEKAAHSYEVECDSKYHWYECTACGALEEAKAEHSGGTATCSHLAQCSVCNNHYGTYNSAVHTDADGNAYETELRLNVAATCTSRGYSGDSYCTSCNTLITKGEILAPLGHSYVDHEAVAATCTATGCEAYKTCENCDYTTYVEVAALGHDYSVLNKNSAGHWYKCSRCEDKQSELVHIYENGVCTLCGYECVHVYADGACVLCGYVCVHTDENGTKATCTTQAVCGICGLSFGDKDGTNHAGTTTWKQTAEKHEEVYTCCGAVKTELAAHTFTNGACSVCGYECVHTGGTATCTTQAMCGICGLSFGDKDGTNHTGATTWKQTAEKHEEVYTCCGAVKTELAAHTFTSGVCTVCGYVCVHTGGTATCTAKAICTYCGEAYGEMLSHDYSVLESDESGHWYKCSNCDSTADKLTHQYDDDNDMICNVCSYDRTTYTVTVSGGTINGTSSESVAFDKNESVTVKAVVPEGKKFVGWYSGETLISENEEYVFSVSENVSLTARFENENESTGLSGGAIAGITIGSVAVAGIGGFAIFWFVIKKKTFVDLIAVFKK